MKVIQIIDSLDAGGAERVAINIANALIDRNIESFICTTRKEGILKENIDANVEYLFLGKKSKIDFKAINKLRLYLKVHNIEIMHAHSSSFFIAVLVKIFNPKLKIIWHDHYGNSEFLNKRPVKILKLASHKFNHIISVNSSLKAWAERNLYTKNVSYISNFVDLNLEEKKSTLLLGDKGKRIVCLANLRPQKGHEMLIDSFKNVLYQYPDWSLHLVGKDFNDSYSKKIKCKINELELTNSIHVYGGRKDVYNILMQSSIGVLSSKSEGLPLSLLEYALAKLPVVATDVGQCKEVIENNRLGRLVETGDEKALSEAITELICEKSLRETLGNNLHNQVYKRYGKDLIVESIIKIYKEVLC